MISVRSFVFNALFYLNVTLWSLVAFATFPLPRRITFAVAQGWARSSIWLAHAVAGIDLDWQGLENIPREACLIASKHQSAFETFALLLAAPYPAIVVKRELLRIPLFGWCMWRTGMIPVDRDAGKETLASLVARVKAALAQGRHVVIFPEGTRRAPGAEADYKLGLAQLYAACAVPCVPAALNSGVFWPRRAFARYRGTIRIEFLPPIPAALTRGAFFRRLQTDIETATGKIVAQGMHERAANE